MTKIPLVLSREKYYLLFSYFHLASEAQKTVQEYEKLISEITGKETTETNGLADAIYNSQMKSTKKEFDELLGKLLVTIEWRPAQNEFAKEQRREKKENGGQK